jgi:hypothetical protein
MVEVVARLTSEQILSMGYGLSFWPVPIFAAVQAGMAAELGNPTDYVWYIPAWSLALTVSFMIAWVKSFHPDRMDTNRQQGCEYRSPRS